jgi:translation elongation factor EF-G
MWVMWLVTSTVDGAIWVAYLPRANLQDKCHVPLSEMFGYVTALRTLTSGRATSTMEFSGYQESPVILQKRLFLNYMV